MSPDPVPTQNVQTPPPIRTQDMCLDFSKAEVSELSRSLKQIQNEKDLQKRRDVIKRVIAFMTLGIDVSRLFGDMIMASGTTDLVQKKMMYLYITTYAESNPDLAILAVNTLQKDCNDQDPTIRGLALRSLSSMRLKNMVEYLNTALRNGLNDASGYVRRNAVIGCLKLYKLDPNAVKNSDMVSVLYDRLQDRDGQVVTDAIYVLSEIFAEEGGLEMTKSMAFNLLNRLNSFSEWGQCAVLKILSSFIPSNDEEKFDIMNILEERLKHSSSGIILACTKCLLKLTNDNLELQLQVIQRLKPPLLTLISTSSHEIAYTVLMHIHLLLSQENSGISCMFRDEYKAFFCRYNDPTYVKNVKLDILQIIASESNVVEILSELSEYVFDICVQISKKSIRVMGNICLLIPSVVGSIMQYLSSFLSYETEHILSATVEVLKDVFRKYPEEGITIAQDMHKWYTNISDDAGLASLIWILGRFGNEIQDAPTIWQFLYKKNEDVKNLIVIKEILCTAMKLFFYYPVEMQKPLGKLLSNILQGTSDPPVRERALLYYRLLQHDPSEAKRVVLNTKEEEFIFYELTDNEWLHQLFSEFDTLSVIFRQPSSTSRSSGILPSGCRYTGHIGNVEAKDRKSNSTQSSPSSKIASSNLEEQKKCSTPDGQTTTIDLLDQSDGLTLLQQPLKFKSLESNIELVECGTITPSFFESQWLNCDVVSRQSQNLHHSIVESITVDDIEEACGKAYIAVMASGVTAIENGKMFRLFLYAKDNRSRLYFVEFVLNTFKKTVDCTIKGSRAAKTAQNDVDSVAEIVLNACSNIFK